MKNYVHSIVCDIDDTISFTTSRDWSNASPNMPVINKLNTLYDAGWHISLYTARGSLSCSTRQEADDTFRRIIETWLKQYNVKYHELSFNKPLATYYVDDKALRPDEFADLDIESLIGGQSGATVERRGDKVYKTAENSINAAAWFKKTETLDTINIPKIYSLIGDTICMDFIKVDTNKTVNQLTLINLINTFKKVESSSPDFYTYRNRVSDHLSLFPYKINGFESLLSESEHFYNKHKSFCHGDFTTDNILVTTYGDHFLIDPIYLFDVYSSWLLDVSKLAMSYKLNLSTHEYDKLYKTFKQHTYHIKLLELTQWIRIRKYSTLELQTRVDNEIDLLMKDIYET